MPRQCLIVVDQQFVQRQGIAILGLGGDETWQFDIVPSALDARSPRIEVDLPSNAVQLETSAQ